MISETLMKGIDKKELIKKYWWFFACILHFGAACLYRNIIFNNSPVYVSNKLIPMAGSFFEGVSKVSTVILILLAAFAILALFWKLIHSFVAGKFKLFHIITFAVIFALTLLFALAYYPDMFAIEPDSYTIYEYAVRNEAYYWHGILMVVFYGGCMTVIPSPFGIAVVQAFLFSLTFTYGFCTSVKRNGKAGAWLALILLLPETFYVALEPYRNCLNAILLLFCLWFVIDEYKNAETKDAKHLFWMIPLLCILSVLRTETVFVGVILFLILVFKCFPLSIKQKLISIGCFVLGTAILFGAQKVGESNYFGSDYLILSTLNPARAILNDGKNLSYDGFGVDIEAIEELCPNIKVEGMLGFTNKNESEGRNIHQSLATKKQQSAFLRGYERLVLRNLSTFVKFQVNTSLKALGASEIYPMTWNYGSSSGRYESYMSEYEHDRNELNSTGFAAAWADSPVRDRLLGVLSGIMRQIRTYLDVTMIPVALHFAAPLFLLYKAIVSFVFAIKNKGKGLADFLIIGALLAMFAAIVVMMPESRSVYFHAVLFGMYAFASELIMRKKEPCKISS